MLSLSLSRSRCFATNLSSPTLLVEDDECPRCGSDCAQTELPVLRTPGAMPFAFSYYNRVTQKSPGNLYSVMSRVDYQNGGNAIITRGSDDRRGSRRSRVGGSIRGAQDDERNGKGPKISIRELQNNEWEIGFIQGMANNIDNDMKKQKRRNVNIRQVIADVAHTHTRRRGAQHVSVALYLARRGCLARSRARLQALTFFGNSLSLANCGRRRPR